MGYDERAFDKAGCQPAFPAGLQASTIAEYSGNSVITIHKFYRENQNEGDIIAELCEEFGN